MSHRPDRLTLSLGPDKAELMESLKALALVLNLPGIDGDGSISQLLIHLARAYAAFAIAGGADWGETIDAL